MKVLIAVDVSNLYYTVKKKFNGARVDYAKLREFCSKYGEIYRALAFASQMHGAGDKFFECLKHLHYLVLTKAVKEYPANVVTCPACNQSFSSGTKRQKADWDVGIAIEIIKYTPRIDVLVLGSGDGDMMPLVKYCQDNGIRVVIVGCGISSELCALADDFCEIGPRFLEEADAPTVTT